MTDHTHLNALEYRAHNERTRLNAATDPREKELRAAWVAQAEKEIDREREHLGLPDLADEPEMTLDEILEALAD
jgi:hypothetical protein